MTGPNQEQEQVRVAFFALFDELCNKNYNKDWFKFLENEWEATKDESGVASVVLRNTMTGKKYLVFVDEVKEE